MKEESVLRGALALQSEQELLQLGCRLILQHAPAAGIFPTTVPGLTLYRIESNEFIERYAGELMTTYILSGRKTTVIGNRQLCYGPGESLVCGIASPSEFRTLDATPEHPFLALSVSLDLSVLMECAAALSDDAPKPYPQDGIFVIRPDQDLAAAFVHLLSLLERPKLIGIRAQPALRELHALLLDSPCGDALRVLASAGSEGYAVLQAAAWIRKNYAQSFSVESLAKHAAMSAATFHRRFRMLTGYSPVQYRKRVRLYEARRQLLAKRQNVTSAAFFVGYDSTARFVRDYKALFGEPPLRDMRKMQESGV